MLFSFSFRWGTWCRQHACRPHRVSHLSSRSVKVSRLIHVNIGPVRGISNGPDSMRVSLRPSVCGLTGSLFLMRFMFSPACENSSESTAVRRTNNGSSQAELCLHSCTGSSASDKLATSLEQTTGRNQRLAHIGDFPGGAPIASSTCRDSKASLPVVLDV